MQGANPRAVPRAAVAAVGTLIAAVGLCSSVPVSPSAQDRSARALQVVFSAPTEGEADVRLDAIVRIQFSRHLDERTLTGRVRASYSTGESAERGEAQPPALPFTLAYDPGTFAITLTPANRLERFREVQVELLEGIVSSEGAALEPWTLRFRTGGADGIACQFPVASGQFKDRELNTGTTPCEPTTGGWKLKAVTERFETRTQRPLFSPLARA